MIPHLFFRYSTGSIPSFWFYKSIKVCDPAKRFFLQHKMGEVTDEDLVSRQNFSDLKDDLDACILIIWHACIGHWDCRNSSPRRTVDRRKSYLRLISGGQRKSPLNCLLKSALLVEKIPAEYNLKLIYTNKKSQHPNIIKYIKGVFFIFMWNWIRKLKFRAKKHGPASIIYNQTKYPAE